MKAKDIRRDQYLVFDPQNTRKQLENGINVIFVRNVYKKHLRYVIEAYIVENNTGALHDDKIVEFRSNLRGDISMLEPLIPNQTVIIRYPEDMPTITSDDCLIIAKMAGKVFNDNNKNSGFSDEEIIRINSLAKKMKFYADCSDHYKILYGGGGDA